MARPLRGPRHRGRKPLCTRQSIDARCRHAPALHSGQEHKELRLHIPSLRQEGPLLRLHRLPPRERGNTRLPLSAGGGEDLRPQPRGVLEGARREGRMTGCSVQGAIGGPQGHQCTVLLSAATCGSPAGVQGRAQGAGDREQGRTDETKAQGAGHMAQGTYDEGTRRRAQG